MGLFDEPEMQLFGFENAGINNAKHYALQQDKMGFFHPPSLDVSLDALKGSPEKYIHWGPTGSNTGNYAPNVDPTMARIFRTGETPSLVNLSPNQDPNFRYESYLRAKQLYENMSLEDIKKLHYTDAASFPVTSQGDIEHRRRMASLAEGYLERQKAIQDFRTGNRSANEQARRLESMGAQQRLYSIAKWGEEQNARYLANLQGAIKQNPIIGDALDQRGMTPESYISRFGADTRQSLSLPDENTMKRRRANTVGMIDEWQGVTKKAGLTPDDFTAGKDMAGGSTKYRTGGFLLNAAGLLGDAGMIGRLLQGGSFMGDIENFDFDVMTPTEIKTIEAAREKGRGVYRNSEGVLEESPYSGI